MATVTRATGQTIHVKNLGWVHRHRKEIARFEIRPGTNGADIQLTAVMNDGAIYRTFYNSATIFHRYVCRSIYDGIRLDYYGCAWNRWTFQTFQNVGYVNSWAVGYFSVGVNHPTKSSDCSEYSLTYCGNVKHILPSN